jgi:hypothetical protein
MGLPFIGWGLYEMWKNKQIDKYNEEVDRYNAWLNQQEAMEKTSKEAEPSLN